MMIYQLDNVTESDHRTSTVQLENEKNLEAMVRVVMGVDECAQVLEQKTDDVLLCLLPKTPLNNFSLHIQQKLLEAFCMENEIPFLSMDDVTNVSATLSQFPVNKNSSVPDDGDIGCILVCKSDMDIQDG